MLTAEQSLQIPCNAAFSQASKPQATCQLLKVSPPMLSLSNDDCMCRQHGLEDPVCIVDLGVVARLFRDWTAVMPRVVPFYAVKANNDEAMIAMLAALGAGFDCASDAEVCTASQAFGSVHVFAQMLRITMSLGPSLLMLLMAKEWRILKCSLQCCSWPRSGVYHSVPCWAYQAC